MIQYDFDLNGVSAEEALDRMHLSLMQESDRGIFIVAAALIEDLMGALLEWQLKRYDSDDKVKKDYLRMVITYHARMTACHALGLIPKEVYDDLVLIKNIRNRVAHNYSHFSLEDVKEEILCLGGVHSANYMVETLALPVEGAVKNSDEELEPFAKFVFSISVSELVFYLSAPIRGLDVSDHKDFLKKRSEGVGI